MMKLPDADAYADADVRHGGKAAHLICVWLTSLYLLNFSDFFIIKIINLLYK